MNPVLRDVLAALGGLALGVLSVKPVLLAVIERVAVHNGPWQMLDAAGSTEANPYVRSAVAVGGIYALSKQETVYYTAFRDSAGALLEGACTYEIAGSVPSARWWSFTMYGADHYLVDNPAGIYSVPMPEATASQVRLLTAVESQPEAWLPSPSSGPFSVTLRLYNPGAAVYENPQSVPLPEIRRLSCAPGVAS